jgi:hypothetical protein
LHKFFIRINVIIVREFQMKIERAGVAKIAIVAIVVTVIVVVAVVAVLLLKPTAEVSPTPTGQATPTPGGEVIPKPGATLIGPIEISQYASGGTINFTVSEDGGFVTSVSITLTHLDVDVFSADSYSTQSGGSFPITGGAFSASITDTGTIEGQFTSPTEASGTINLKLKITYAGTFELGTWNWSAKAD